MSILGKVGRRAASFALGLLLPSAPMSLRTVRRFGRKLPVILDQHTSRLIYLGVFERTETKYFLRSLRPSDVCMDIGANVGYYTALFASRACKVVAIDPVWQNVSLIRLAQAMNRDGHVEVIQAAVGERVGREEFEEYRETSTSRLASLSKGGSSSAAEPVWRYSVDTITIDSLELERVDVVKMDIEGAEYSALLGMSRTIQRARPRLLMLELVDEHLKRAGRGLDSVLQLMDNWGYEAKVLGSKGLEPYCGRLPVNDNFFFIAR